MRETSHQLARAVDEGIFVSQDEDPTSSIGQAVKLPDGSDYLFCSHACAAMAWVLWAAVLSPGPARWLQQAVRESPYITLLDLDKVPAHILEACTMHGRLNSFPTACSQGDCCEGEVFASRRRLDANCLAQFYRQKVGITFL
jgi:hypothetical protein